MYGLQIKSKGDLREREQLQKIEEEEDGNEEQEESDVMDRICHDLDYLLGGSPSRDKEISNIMMQNTSL